MRRQNAYVLVQLSPPSAISNGLPWEWKKEKGVEAVFYRSFGEMRKLDFTTRLVLIFILIFFRQLCLLLNAEDIYRALSEIIGQEEDLQFASLMVRYLNMILLTSSELFDLRDQLRELATSVRKIICADFLP